MTLEADLVEAALRLLSCTDCHKEKIPILKSILSQEGEANADIFKLIFPQCLKNVIIRIIKIQDTEPYTQAIAYEDGVCTEHRYEVNLLLNKGHFTILTDSSFLDSTPFRHYDKSLNFKLNEPICPQFSIKKYSRHKNIGHSSIINEIPQGSACDAHTPTLDPPEHIDSIPCECGNSSFVAILNILKCTACKQVREYIVLSSDSDVPTDECIENTPLPSLDQKSPESITSDVEKTFEDEDDLEVYGTSETCIPPNIVTLETDAKGKIIERIVNFFQYYFQQSKQFLTSPPIKTSIYECKRNLRVTPNHGTLPTTELFEPDDYDIFLKFEQEIFQFKVILFSAACSFLIHTDNGWKNNQYLLAHLYNDSDQPFIIIVFSHRSLQELPRNLTNVLRIFNETFVTPKCSIHVSSSFTSNVTRLCDNICHIITAIPYTSKSDNIPWPISEQFSFKVPRHPRGKWEAWVAPGIQVHRMHTKSQWVQYILALNHSDLLASSLSQYLQFCTIFNYIPNVTDMTSYRIYGELYCALKGGFLNEIKQRLPGYTLADIVDEINLLRRIKYYDPMSPTSARTLLSVLIESQWWLNWENHTGNDRLPSHKSDNISGIESNRIFHKAPPCLVSAINSQLSHTDGLL